MEIIVFWGVTPCSLVERDVSEELAASTFIYPDMLNEIWI
jgi:hypothetical protein